MIEAVLKAATKLGADLAGWAALDRGELPLYSLLERTDADLYHSALVVAKAHHLEVLKEPEKLPTFDYDRDYRRLNRELCDLVLNIEGHLKEQGIACRAVNPSETLDHAQQRGLVSHRALAERAGLGIRGRNNLLVTYPHRSRVRLASILTELRVPHVPKPVWPYPCDQCDHCREACPAKALGERPSDFRLDRCLEYLDKICIEGISPQICGLCLAACPPFNQAITGN